MLFQIFFIPNKYIEIRKEIFILKQFQSFFINSYEIVLITQLF